MSEDPTRATPRVSGWLPSHGSVGPLDPHADPATDPNMRPVRIDTPAPTERLPSVAPPAPQAPGAPPVPDEPTGPSVTRTRSGILYAGLILSAIVLLFLLIFILQNLEPVRITFLGFSGSLPIGVAMLMAAIAGLLLVAIPGGLRILQLRRAARQRPRKAS
jgi:uncharacterized integral membrane protein